MPGRASRVPTMARPAPHRAASTAESQIRALAHAYLAHGGKGSRRKRILRLVTAAQACLQRFALTHVDQLGRRHVLWWDEQLRQAGYSDKTRLEYRYAWRTLWVLLGRRGRPPMPAVRPGAGREHARPGAGGPAPPARVPP